MKDNHLLFQMMEYCKIVILKKQKTLIQQTMEIKIGFLKCKEIK